LFFFIVSINDSISGTKNLNPTKINNAITNVDPATAVSSCVPPKQGINTIDATFAA